LWKKGREWRHRLRGKGGRGGRTGPPKRAAGPMPKVGESKNSRREIPGKPKPSASMGVGSQEGNSERVGKKKRGPPNGKGKLSRRGVTGPTPVWKRGSKTTNHQKKNGPEVKTRRKMVFFGKKKNTEWVPKQGSRVKRGALEENQVASHDKKFFEAKQNKKHGPSKGLNRKKKTVAGCQTRGDQRNS